MMNKLMCSKWFTSFVFYASLIKMVYAIAAKSHQRPRWYELEHAIKRNFGGLIERDPVEIFKRYYTEKDVSWRTEQY